MRIFECPKCGQDISHTYESDDPDTGIYASWYCDVCDIGFGDEDGPEPHDDDVQLFGTCGGPEVTTLREKCPAHPEAILEMGYGLAGGGIGPYSYCPICGSVVSKSQDHG